MRLRTAVKELTYKSAATLRLDRAGLTRLRGGLIVFTYHSFCRRSASSLNSSIEISKFIAQASYIRQHFQIVRLIDGIRLVGGVDDSCCRPMAAITVDDGFSNNFDLLFPVAKRLQLPITIFLATDFIDTGRLPWAVELNAIIESAEARALSWPFSAPIGSPIERSQTALALRAAWSSFPPAERSRLLDELGKHARAHPHEQQTPLTWGQVREMQSAGVHFGSHTVHHSRLSDVAPSIAEDELRRSKARIESKLGTPCMGIAYPDGAHNEEVQGMAQAAGYEYGLTQDRGVNRKNQSPLALARVDVPYNESLATFACRASLVAL